MAVYIIIILQKSIKLYTLSVSIMEYNNIQFEHNV